MASTKLKADVVIQFVLSTSSLSKQGAHEIAQEALQEYTGLLKTLEAAGLTAAGKPGNSSGEILVLVSCPWGLLTNLVERERCVVRSLPSKQRLTLSILIQIFRLYSRPFDNVASLPDPRLQGSSAESRRAYSPDSCIRYDQCYPRRTRDCAGK